MDPAVRRFLKEVHELSTWSRVTDRIHGAGVEGFDVIEGKL